MLMLVQTPLPITVNGTSPHLATPSASMINAVDTLS